MRDFATGESVLNGPISAIEDVSALRFDLFPATSVPVSIHFALGSAVWPQAPWSCLSETHRSPDARPSGLIDDLGAFRVRE